MSSAIWTPGALWPERRRLSGPCWRVVESQHRVSTMKLVDTLEEQELLEVLVESTKPQVPAECRHLHYLLFTPFRYGAPYPEGSRFRRSGLTPGVFYGSQTPATAIAEMAFHRLLFFAESPDTPWPANAGEYTAFLVEFKTSAALDLTAPPLASDRPRWTARTDYRACQDLADHARTAGIEVLRYESARAPVATGRHQPGAHDLPRVRLTSAETATDVADPPRGPRRARSLRISRSAPGFRPRRLC